MAIKARVKETRVLLILPREDFDNLIHSNNNYPIFFNLIIIIQANHSLHTRHRIDPKFRFVHLLHFYPYTVLYCDFLWHFYSTASNSINVPTHFWFWTLDTSGILTNPFLKFITVFLLLNQMFKGLLAVQPTGGGPYIYILPNKIMMTKLKNLIAN